MSDRNNSGSNGIGIFGVLGIVFVVLKLVGVIDWSWWWVTLPFWGGVVAVVIGLIGFFIVISAAHAWESFRK